MQFYRCDTTQAWYRHTLWPYVYPSIHCNPALYWNSRKNPARFSHRDYPEPIYVVFEKKLRYIYKN